MQGSTNRWTQIFRRWDRNHDGKLTMRELEKALNASGQQRELSEVEEIMRSADIDCDGTLSTEEFLTLMRLMEINTQ